MNDQYTRKVPCMAGGYFFNLKTFIPLSANDVRFGMGRHSGEIQTVAPLTMKPITVIAIYL